MPPAPLLNIKDLSITMAGERLFEGLSLSIEPGELVAVFGANGCGKSTLLNLIMAQARGRSFMAHDTASGMGGSIVIPAGVTPAYLPQKMMETVLSAGHGENGIRSIRAKLGWDFGIGELDQSPDLLSGGELQKLGLIHVLASDSALYLLDEPTNHLDIAGITAFEHHVASLKQRGKGVILVTHDRALADNLADRTILLTRHGIYLASGGASAVWSVETGDYEARSRQAKEIGKKIRQLQQDARVKAGWSAKSERRKIGAGADKPYLAKLSKKMAKRSKVVQRRIEKEARHLDEAKPFVAKRVSLHFPHYQVRHREVFHLRDVFFHYGDPAANERTSPNLLGNINLSMTTRDRVCLMGSNGSGKSTLMRLIRKQLRPVLGELYLNEGVKITHVSQGLTGFFAKGRLLDNFEGLNLSETSIRQHLGSVLIRGDKAREPLGSFSQGELMRAAAVKCVLERAEFLLLDEPTLHLDIESVEVLERLLKEFKGGYLIISHDRTFVTRVANRLYFLEGGGLRLV